MPISRGEKDIIRGLMRSNNKESLKLLFKLLNSSLNDIDDKYFVMYNIALENKKQGNIEMSKFYVKQLKDIMDSIDYGYGFEKIKSTWLYIAIYEDDISKAQRQDMFENMLQDVSKYLSDDDEFTLGIKANIYYIEEKYDECLNIFKICLKRHYIEMCDNILNDLKKKEDIYIKALQIKREHSKKSISYNNI